MCSKVLPHEVEYQDMFEVAAALRDELRADGAQVIIAITHCRTVIDEELADRVPGPLSRIVGNTGQNGEIQEKYMN